MPIPRSKPARAALLLISASVLLHVVYAGFVGLSPQEAYYWTWSRRLALSYYDHPPLASWTIRLATSLFGETERGIRAAAAFHGAIFAAFLFLAGRRLFGERAALLALAFAMLAPITGLGQVVVTPDVPLLSGWVAALYFTVRALDEEDGRWLLAAGAAAGFAALGKYTAFILLPQILLALLLDPRGRRLLAKPWPWLGVVLAVAVFSPVLVWNAGHGWVSLLFQSSGRTSTFGLRPILVGRFVALQALMVSPLLWLSCLAAAFVAARRWREPSWRVAAIFSVPLITVMILVSPFHWVKGNWGAPAYPAALLAGAAIALERWDALRGWTWATGVLAGVSSLYMLLVPLVPALPFPARDETTSGWRQLAARVEAERRAIGGDPLVVGCTYKPAAELEFNLPGRPATQSGGIFGANGLQYDVWLDPAAVRGRELLLVVDGREADACTAREALCRPLSELPPEEVFRGRQRATTFRLFRCAVPADAGIALPRWRGGTR
ncbi:MAG: glycosyltransferase family 39 protein [Anaeromyxobacteraceae bacterium]